MKLEVCAFNIQSSIIAERVGAVRVELCDNPVEGGTTPSYGHIRQTRDKISVQLYPIIRPRAGSYFYDENEFEIMLHDIRVCKELQCDGISVGIQNPDGTIDRDRLSKIVELAYPMGVTCNRAFDAAPEPMQALEDIIATGCERILTSGQKTSAPEGASLLAELVKRAEGRIVIMPGAGVRSSNLLELIQLTSATEYHTSARMLVAENVSYQNPAVSDIGNVYIANEEELKKVMEVFAVADRQS